MKAKYYKIYASKRLKEADKEMGFVKEMDNTPINNSYFIIYKTGTLFECVENFSGYSDLFEKKRCTKKEFKKAFDEAINFYKKLV